jgi:hypothetical protein
MMAPWNSFSACLLAKSDRIGADRIDLLNRSDVIPLGLGNALSRFYIKNCISSERGWSLFMAILVNYTWC